MVKNDKSQDKLNPNNQFNQHVSINKGQNYCVVSCSKHRMPDFIDVIDEMTMKGWEITSGITSDDGLVFQTLIKPSKIN